MRSINELSRQFHGEECNALLLAMAAVASHRRVVGSNGICGDLLGVPRPFRALIQTKIISESIIIQPPLGFTFTLI